MNRFQNTYADDEPKVTSEQEEIALEVSQARAVVARMREVMKSMDNNTDLGAVVEDFAARLECAAAEIEHTHHIPPGPRAMLALGNSLLAAE